MKIKIILFSIIFIVFVILALYLNKDITFNEIIENKNILYMQFYYGLDKTLYDLSSEQETVILELLANLELIKISEDDVPLIYGGPIYIKFISDANTDIICSIYDSEHLSFKQKDKTMYYRDSSGTLNNLLTYVNKAYYEIAERNNYACMLAESTNTGESVGHATALCWYKLSSYDNNLFNSVTIMEPHYQCIRTISAMPPNITYSIDGYVFQWNETIRLLYNT